MYTVAKNPFISLFMGLILEVVAMMKKTNSMLGIIREGVENEVANIVCLKLWCCLSWKTAVLLTVPQKGPCRAGESIEEGNQDD